MTASSTGASPILMGHSAKQLHSSVIAGSCTLSVAHQQGREIIRASDNLVWVWRHVTGWHVREYFNVALQCKTPDVLSRTILRI